MKPTILSVEPFLAVGIILHGSLYFTDAATSLETNTKPVVGLSVTLQCRSGVAITQAVSFSTDPGGVVQGSCLASGTCGSTVTGYTVSQERSKRLTTLTIDSFDVTRDNKVWYCADTAARSPDLNLPAIGYGTILNKTGITIDPQTPKTIKGDETLRVNITTPCSFPSANITVSISSGGSGEVTSTTSSSADSCSGSDVRTQTVFSVSGSSSQVKCVTRFNVSIEHESFIDDPNYTYTLEYGPITFPASCPNGTLSTPHPDNSTTTGTIDIIAFLVVIILFNVVEVVLIIIHVCTGNETRKILRWVLFGFGICIIACGIAFFIVILTEACKPLIPEAIVVLVFSVVGVLVGGGGIIVSWRKKAGGWYSCDDGCCPDTRSPKTTTGELNKLQGVSQDKQSRKEKHDREQVSGHEYIVRDEKNGEYFLASHLIKAHLLSNSVDENQREKMMAKIDGMGKDEIQSTLRRYQIKSPFKGNMLSDPIVLNLMFPKGNDVGGGLRRTPDEVDGFQTFIVRDLDTNDFFRADHLIEVYLKKQLKERPNENQQIRNILSKIHGMGENEIKSALKTYNIKSPNEGNDLSDPIVLNLMFTKSGERTRSSSSVQLERL